MDINSHEFDFNLSMDGFASELKMDGENLEGVKNLFIKAGTNGFTNVAIEFEGPVAVKFVGALVANLDMNDPENELLLARVYRNAMEKRSETLWETDVQADFVKDIIAGCLEEIASGEH